MDLLLNQLFYLSKLETGNMPFDFQMIDICEFVRNYVKGKQELVENGQTEITADIKENIGYVSVDPGQLQRIFDNLLENSKRYGNVIPLKIKISLEKNKEGFCICFSDNGVGVPEEKLPYIFDEFYCGDESRNQKEGNGLGLYIVRYLTKAMGGRVWAENIGGLAVCLELKEGEFVMSVVIIPAYKPDETLITITDQLWAYGCQMIVMLKLLEAAALCWITCCLHC